MTRVEQHKMITELRDYARKMSRYDEEDFSMFVKRDKDDEYLDSLSEARLIKLYEKYHPDKDGWR